MGRGNAKNETGSSALAPVEVEGVPGRRSCPAVGGDLGAEVNLSSLASEDGLGDDAKLFSESNSRFVITCAPEDAEEVETIFRDVPCTRVGTVLSKRRVCITGAGNRRLVDMDIDALRRAFKDTLYGV